MSPGVNGIGIELLYQRNIPVNIEDEMRTDLDLERLPSGKFAAEKPRPRRDDTCARKGSINALFLSKNVPKPA